MGFSVVRNHISITRGDSAVITLIIQNRVTGDVFMPSGEDKLTMTVKAAISDTEPSSSKHSGTGLRIKTGSVSCT